ncbi:MAG TPA: hypothetical protein VLF69_04305 [Candidatus Saccharimonadales bacterium]|nr:hypothetical protein [Candidatus Saccharimonadales bacterium]
MTRLPVPGQDDGTWGDVLNAFLSVAHNSDGTLANTGLLAAKADDSAVVHLTGSEVVAGTKTFSASPVVPTPTLGSQAANKTYVDSVASSGAPNATTSSVGLVQLAGDLGGTSTTATAPVITDGAITNSKLAAGAVTTTKLGAGAVTTNEIADGTITNTDISASAAIAKSKLAALGIVDADVSSISNTKISGLGGAATLNVGTTNGTVAAGDDSRITGAVQKSTFTTKGDILVTTGASTPARLGVGSDTQVLTADSSQTSGVKWAAVSAVNSHSIVTKSTAYSATTSDEVILVNAASAGVTITLPTAVGNTNLYRIKKIDSSTNFVTIATSSAQTIDGGATAVVKVQYVSVSLVSDGSNWSII